MRDFNFVNFSSSYLFVTQVVHPCRHVHSELQQLLGGECGRSAMLLGEGRIGLQHSTLPQEVEKVTIGSIFDGDIQVAWKRQRVLIRVIYLMGMNRAKAAANNHFISYSICASTTRTS